MTTLAIARLSNHVASPDAETAMAAAALLDRATRRLPQALAALMPSVLTEAGLPPDAVVGLRRLDLKLHVTDAMDGDTVAARWAAAIVAALAAALWSVRPRSPALARPADASPPLRSGAPDRLGDSASPAATPDSDRDDADVVAFADLWFAEAAWLRYLASGSPAPWWETALGVRPAGVHDVLAGWIARDAGRGAVLLLELMQAAPDLPALLSARAADQLAAALSGRLRAAIPAAWLEEEGAPPAALPAGLLPPALDRALAAIPADRRAPFMLAALVTHAPAWTPALARVAVADFASLTPPSAAAVAATMTGRRSPERRGEAAGVAVLQGGLLLLLRPLAESGLLDGLRGGALAEVLHALGLAALRRPLAGLPLASRRTLMERDRELLAVFAGVALPEAPLDTLPASPDADHRLDALLSRAPAGVGWAQGALRAGYGDADPFGDTPDGALARILLRPGRLAWTRWSADLTWPLASADVALRRAGWDIDPGWLPWIGRTVRFHYDGPDPP